MDIDFREIRKLHRQLESAAGNRFSVSLRRAFLSTRRGALTQAKRSIAQQYNLSQKQIAKHLTLGAADLQNLRFSVYGFGVPLNLISFTATSQRKSGVSARILKTGGRKIYRSAWIGPDLGGERLVLRRIPGSKKRRMQAGRYRNSRILRQPIESLKGPSVGPMLETDKTVNDLITFAAGKYEAELRRLVKVALRNGP